MHFYVLPFVREYIIVSSLQITIAHSRPLSLTNNSLFAEFYQSALYFQPWEFSIIALFAQFSIFSRFKRATALSFRYIRDLYIFSRWINHFSRSLLSRFCAQDFESHFHFFLLIFFFGFLRNPRAKVPFARRFLWESVNDWAVTQPSVVLGRGSLGIDTILCLDYLMRVFFQMGMNKNWWIDANLIDNFWLVCFSQGISSLEKFSCRLLEKSSTRRNKAREGGRGEKGKIGGKLKGRRSGWMDFWLIGKIDRKKV